ncbi:MAG: hypothetical protein ACFB15_03255 [Cyclobacteriaceae bacterium]
MANNYNAILTKLQNTIRDASSSDQITEQELYDVSKDILDDIYNADVLREVLENIITTTGATKLNPSVLDGFPFASNIALPELITQNRVVLQADNGKTLILDAAEQIQLSLDNGISSSTFLLAVINTNPAGSMEIVTDQLNLVSPNNVYLPPPADGGWTLGILMPSATANTLNNICDWTVLSGGGAGIATVQVDFNRYGSEQTSGIWNDASTSANEVNPGVLVENCRDINDNLTGIEIAITQAFERGREWGLSGGGSPFPLTVLDKSFYVGLPDPLPTTSLLGEIEVRNVPIGNYTFRLGGYSESNLSATRITLGQNVQVYNPQDNLNAYVDFAVNLTEIGTVSFTVEPDVGQNFGFFSALAIIPQ